MFAKSNIRHRRDASGAGGAAIETLLPRSLISPVNAALAEHGDSTAVRAIQTVKGGYTSHALKLTTRRDAYFLKWNPDFKRGRFAGEARALAMFRDTGTIAVPHVLAAVDAVPEQPGFLLQDWLSPPSRDQYLRRVGEGLGAKVAALHRAPTDGGYRHDLLDDAPEQDERDWHRFLRERCFPPLIEWAEVKGMMPTDRRRSLDRLLDRLDTALGGMDHRPSLLHGDLWRNNVLCNAAGELVLIDPNPWIGDREAELAYTEWAGSFPPKFYEAYEAVWPSAPGRQERRDVYLIWCMLRCLARGEPRGLAIDGTLRWYLGPT